MLDLESVYVNFILTLDCGASYPD